MNILKKSSTTVFLGAMVMTANLCAADFNDATFRPVTRRGNINAEITAELAAAVSRYEREAADNPGTDLGKYYSCAANALSGLMRIREAKKSSVLGSRAGGNIIDEVDATIASQKVAR
jgi:hypothetical protein